MMNLMMKPTPTPVPTRHGDTFIDTIHAVLNSPWLWPIVVFIVLLPLAMTGSRLLDRRKRGD
jgi:NADH:ubiquinone oxidoreductase subunit 6 (subunit J)